MLVQFGGLLPQHVLDHNVSAMRDAAEAAKTTIQRCVVGSSDHLDDSNELVQHYFPWLGESMKSTSLPKMNVGATLVKTLAEARNATSEGSPTGPASHAEQLLSDDTVRLLQYWYALEVDMHAYAMEVHRAQLAHVRAVVAAAAAATASAAAAAP